MHKLREVVIELTSRCNLRCIHCGSDCDEGIKESELSLPEWKRCLKQLSGMGVEKVVFSGGEPTLRKDFENILGFSKEIGLKFGFISNGFFFKESLLTTLKDSRPFTIGLSFDGIGEMHSRIRGNPKSWNNLLTTISDIQRLEIPICLVTTLHKLNHAEIFRMARFIQLAGIKTWQLQLAMPAGRMKNRDDLLLTESIFSNICEDIKKVRDDFPEIYIQAADCFGMDPENLIRSCGWEGCTAGLSSVGIDSFGNVIPCLSLRSDLRCGNLREQSLADIWRNSGGFSFNRDFDKNKVIGGCSGCDLLEKCRGGCSSQSFAHHGRLHDAPFCFFRSGQRLKKEE